MVTALTSHLVSEFKYKPKRINPHLLPDDLWKVILEFGDFDMSDLSNIRLTCKHFAALGALETRYHFTLYTTNIYRRIVPSASDVLGQPLKLKCAGQSVTYLSLPRCRGVQWESRRWSYVDRAAMCSLGSGSAAHIPVYQSDPPRSSPHSSGQ